MKPNVSTKVAEYIYGRWGTMDYLELREKFNLETFSIFSDIGNYARLVEAFANRTREDVSKTSRNLNIKSHKVTEQSPGRFVVEYVYYWRDADGSRIEHVCDIEIIKV